MSVFGAIVSAPHLAMKFPSDTKAIIIVHVDQRLAKECYMASLKLGLLIKDERHQGVHYVEIVAEIEGLEGLDLDPRTKDDSRVKPMEETWTFQFDLKEGQATQLGSQLSSDDRSNMQQIIREHIDLFAWSATNMLGVDSASHCHRLSICKNAKIITQRKRKMLSSLTGSFQTDGRTIY